VKTPRVVLYPFLAALYSVLALAATNREDLVRASDLLKPCTIPLSATLVAWLLRLVLVLEQAAV